MIQLKKINGEIFFANPDYILRIESTPDTVITFSNNDRLIVLDSPADIATATARLYEMRVKNNDRNYTLDTRA